MTGFIKLFHSIIIKEERPSWMEDPLRGGVVRSEPVVGSGPSGSVRELDGRIARMGCSVEALAKALREHQERMEELSLSLARVVSARKETRFLSGRCGCFNEVLHSYETPVIDMSSTISALPDLASSFQHFREGPHMALFDAQLCQSVRCCELASSLLKEVEILLQAFPETLSLSDILPAFLQLQEALLQMLDTPLPRKSAQFVGHLLFFFLLEVE